MTFARIGAAGHERPVIESKGEFFDLTGVTGDLGPEFFASGGVAAARAALAAGSLAPVPDAGSLRIGAPIARPGKIVCIGLNYSDHAAETNAQIPAEPILFMKDPSTVVGPNDDVLIPRASTKTDWEIELGIVIGSTARYVESPDAAAAHIAGYVLCHDVSEREFQLERGGQWDKGKNCETFNPMGPWFVPADEVADPQDLSLKLWVNGALKQNGTTANMVFGVNYLVWYVSQFMVLHPGDIINSGTPAGVALGQPDKPYLRAGDVVELEIEGLGRMAQKMVQA
jgi:2-keto-4-pentenoate hydratase/2-oxohepta-3-ene-1,7-dioic acid hydratase in catechol pathway